jgi:ABC-type dipeptide/oligopeptide/nickel transport system permease subunit
LPIVLVAILAPWVAPRDPLAMQLGHVLARPGAAAWLGTDNLGRDLFSRIVHGARLSLLSGTVAVAIGLVLGVPVGLLAAYWGGWVDLFLMRVVDVLLSFPTILVAIVVVSILGTGVINAVLAIGIASMPLYARLTRSAALGVQAQEFVTAARALGQRDGAIMRRHILPGCTSAIVVQSTVHMATALLTIAGLSFLGLGAQPPSPEWGALVSASRQYVRAAPHLAIFPGLAIMVSVLGLNLLGDGLNDVLNPRLKKL